MSLLAGVDEAGRGPLAGPVIAAAVILDPAYPITGLQDSKQLSAKRREQLYEQIQQYALSYAIASASVAEIDQLNILQASLLAMQRAVNGLSVAPKIVQVDGKFCPEIPYPVTAIIKGDSKVAAIAAASILAKVSRDRLMQQLDQRYPGYELAKHKGYPTNRHRQLLRTLGPSPIHRHSFAPVRAVL